MNEELKYTFDDVVRGLSYPCYPYGSERHDGDRYKCLLIKIRIVEDLVYEIEEAGRLYNRSEFSIAKISNKANEYLADLRDHLNYIDYLPKYEDDD